jgi:hypothetical protein
MPGVALYSRTDPFTVEAVLQAENFAAPRENRRLRDLAADIVDHTVHRQQRI